jgi:hypothetical protein
MQHHSYRTLGLVLIGIVIGILLSQAMSALAGNLEPSYPPESTSFYSLQDIYNRLDTGAAGAQSTFTEPISSPGSTMPTVNEIMAIAPATHTNAATQTQILSGTVAWGLSEGAWGVITGTGTMEAGVPKTGQTTCYNTSGTVISCTGTGQDGEYQLGVNWPNPRFITNTTGTLGVTVVVTDTLTGLVWLQDANCIANQYPGFDNDDTSGDGRVTWQHALDFVAGINAGTYPGCSASFNDWRLPNVREWQILIDYGESNPALPDGYPFTSVHSNDYWSSTTNAGNTLDAWSVYLYNGHVNHYDKTLDYYVWPVRGRQ